MRGVANGSEGWPSEERVRKCLTTGQINEHIAWVAHHIEIDYKNPETLRRFITDRGKIIPRRISGATAKQQRAICTAVKRARYLALLPFSIAHRQERNFAAEMSAIATSAIGSASRHGNKSRAPKSQPKEAETAAPAEA